VTCLPKQVDSKTHHWEIFLYSPTGEDMAKWIENCTFHLHETFENPKRTCKKEPYKVSENGWGEFDVQIEIHPKESIPFVLIHSITFPQANSKKPSLIHRRKGYIVFKNPPPLLFEGLISAPFTWNRLKKIKSIFMLLMQMKMKKMQMTSKWKQNFYTRFLKLL
jgi:YEATS domain-containing protein 4